MPLLLALLGCVTQSRSPITPHPADTAATAPEDRPEPSSEPSSVDVTLDGSDTGSLPPSQGRGSGSLPPPIEIALAHGQEPTPVRVGDVDGDGLDDLGLASPAYGGGRIDVPSGLLLGSPSTAAGLRWEQPKDLGQAVVVLPDGTVAAGAPAFSNPTTGAVGRVFLLPTGGGVVPDSSPAELDGVLYEALTGTSLAVADDLYGDGATDLAVGGRRGSVHDTSTVRVIELPVAGRSALGDISQTVITGTVGHDLSYPEFDGTMLGGHDVDGDGSSDLVVVDAGLGASFVFRSMPTGSITAQDGDFSLPGWVTTAGDLDGDGLDDLVAGDADHVAVFAGPRTAAASWTDASATLPRMPADVSGDLDGDGVDDAIAVENHDETVAVWHGPLSGHGVDPDATWSALPTDQASTGVAAYVGDVNGDGRDDFAATLARTTCDEADCTDVDVHTLLFLGL